MSYILDALQKAEADRERGRVPGLKSQQVPPPSHDLSSFNAVRPWLLAASVATILAGLGGWWWLASEETVAVTVVTVPPVTSQPGTSAPTVPAPVAPLQSTPPTLPDRIETTREPVQPILAPPRPAPVATPSPPAAVPAPPATTPSPMTAAAGSPASAAPATMPAPASTKPSTAVPTFGELTAEARGQLPAVNVSGSTYSQNPSLRMLIANGKVVQEGQDIAPGLRLETIGPRSAVLNHQGLRYSIGY